MDPNPNTRDPTAAQNSGNPGAVGGFAGLSLMDEFKQNRTAELQLDIVESLATQFQSDLDKDTEIKDELRAVVRQLERASKAVAHILQRIHIDAESDEKARKIGEKAEEMLRNEVAPIVLKCAEKMPPGEYYKYADIFRRHIVRSVFGVGLSKFLIDGSFATIQYVSEVIQIPTANNRGSSSIFLEWEEYLEGMIDVGQELSRLAKNCVILDNYPLVGRIHSYISTLTYGFSGMNFRNDGLRRRYDSLKYDSRAIEEVVYDLKMQKGSSTSST